MVRQMIRIVFSRTIIADCILFPAFFLCVRFWVNPSLLYYYPGFFLNVTVETYAPWFITGAPAYPGKLTDLIVSFLTPFLAGPWAGTVVITVIAFVMCWLLGRFLVNIGAHNVLELKFVPGALMLIQLGLVVNPLPAVVSIILGIAFVLLYQVAGRLAAWRRWVLFVFLSAAVYGLAIQSFVAFVVLCIVLEIAERRDWRSACVQAAMAVLVPLAVGGIFFPLYSPLDAYNHLVPNLPKTWSVTAWLPLVFWIVSPLIAIVAAFHGLIGRVAAVLKRKIPRSASIVRHSALRGILTSALIALFTSGAVWMCRGAAMRSHPGVVIHYAMLTRNWDVLLGEAEKTPQRFLTPYHINAVDRALYYKGRLLEDLFKVPQYPKSLLLFPFAKSTGPTEGFQNFIWGGWTWFDLGLINVAEHCALEALTECYYPQGLQLLSKIYFVKNMPQAGRMCLAALGKDGGYRQWAKAYADSVGAGSTVSLTPELRNIRAMAITTEFVVADTSLLASLVRENPGNRMAFEYLIAWNLITRNVDSLARYAELFRALKYPKIPLLVEEALLLRGAFGGNRPALFGYAPSEEAEAAFSKFFTILFTKHNGKPDEAFDDLAESCGYSYFFYYTYGFSKAMINEKE